MPSTRTSRRDDVLDLGHALIHLLGIHPDTVDASPTNQALQRAGVETFTELLSLTEKDIMELDYVEDPTGLNYLEKLQISKKRLLTILISFYHYLCVGMKEEVSIRTATKEMFIKLGQTLSKS